jgi:hypothetical protein
LQTTPALYAHVLLFACPQCSRPLATACASPKRSLEDADAHRFDPHCHCGWAGPLVGFEASKHWVQPWGEIAATAGTAKPEDASCDSKPLKS